jgi:hypothetical protein
MAHQTGRGGGAHGAGNASLEEGEEVLEDEEEDEEVLEAEDEDGEEELLADDQYSETESAFEVRLPPTVEPSSVWRVLRVVLTGRVSCVSLVVSLVVSCRVVGRVCRVVSCVIKEEESVGSLDVTGDDLEDLP